MKVRQSKLRSLFMEQTIIPFIPARPALPGVGTETQLLTLLTQQWQHGH